jgi:CheY-like chemotaxis protein
MEDAECWATHGFWWSMTARWPCSNRCTPCATSACNATRAQRQEAIDCLLDLQGTAQQINLIVSDIEMSEMDGYAFTRTLRETPDFALYVLLHLAGQRDEQRKGPPGRCQRGADQVLLAGTDPVPDHGSQGVAERSLSLGQTFCF